MSFNTIAQTINQPSQVQSGGADLYFSAAGGTVVVALTAADDTGMPAQALAEVRLQPSAIKTDGTATRVLWPAPLLLQANTRYLLCALAADAVTALHVGKVGETTADGAVTASQAAVGELLHINPDGFETRYTDRMLKFELLAVAYAAQQKDITIGEVPVVGATALMVKAEATQPEATARVSYQLDLLDAGGATVSTTEVDADQLLQLSSPHTGKVRVKATLRVGASGLGAVLEPGAMLVVGVLQPEGTYVTPAVTTGGGSDLRVIYEALVPAGAAVAVHSQIVGDSDWEPVPFSSSTNAAGVVEISHRELGLAGDALRLRLTITGSSAARPLVRNLRAAVL